MIHNPPKCTTWQNNKKRYIYRHMMLVPANQEWILCAAESAMEPETLIKKRQKKNNHKKPSPGGSWLPGCGKGLVPVVTISK